MSSTANSLEQAYDATLNLEKHESNGSLFQAHAETEHGRQTPVMDGVKNSQDDSKTPQGQFKSESTDLANQISSNDKLQGQWRATLIQNPNENPRVKIAIDLPWMDLSNNVAITGPMVLDTNRLSIGSRTLSGARLNEMSGGPPYTQRSIVYRGVSSRTPLDLGKVDGTDQPVDSDSYIAAMTDLDKMLESKVDWKRFEQLEHAVWVAQSDPKCPNFIRQGSVSSYIRVLKSALNKCRESLDVLKRQADDYFSKHETTLTPVQLQKFAHFRLMSDDTFKEIQLVEKNLNNPNLFNIDAATVEKDILHRKRYPMVTPTRVRERYANQVRVITEMLTLLEELLNSARNEDTEHKTKLF